MLAGCERRLGDLRLRPGDDGDVEDLALRGEEIVERAEDSADAVPSGDIAGTISFGSADRRTRRRWVRGALARSEVGVQPAVPVPAGPQEAQVGRLDELQQRRRPE